MTTLRIFRPICREFYSGAFSALTVLLLLACWLYHLLGSFGTLRKVTPLRHVSPLVRKELLGCHWTHFHDICYLSFFPESLQKSKFSLKWDKNNGYFYMNTDMHVWSYLSQVFIGLKMFWTILFEEIELHILLYIYIYIYTECFTTLGHNCRRWFPRSLWWKKFI